MIRTLRLSNFQRHRSLTLKLDPHVTTIVGPSDIGKSTVLRALTWALTNRPRGADFARHGTQQARVTVRLDKRDLQRTKGKGNTYKLDGKTYRAFGNEPPAEVSSLVNVSPLNFQPQHDIPPGTGPLFWFSLPPGEVSKRLNQIVDLSLIDTTLANLAKRTRRTSIESNLVEDRVHEARRDVRKLEHIEKADEALSRLERMQKQHAQHLTRASRLRELVSEAEEHQARVKRVRVPSLGPLEKQGRRLKQLRDKLEALQEHIATCEKLQETVRQVECEHSEKHAELTETMGDVCGFCGQAVPE